MPLKFILFTLIIYVTEITAFKLNPININNVQYPQPTIEITLPSEYFILGHSNDLSWQFLGIPYAKPPIDHLRFAETQPLTSSYVYLDAYKTAPACPQICLLPDYACSQDTSEDCLYLNIYTPLQWNPKSYETYDVLVFFPGGDYIQGTAGCPLYDSR